MIVVFLAFLFSMVLALIGVPVLSKLAKKIGLVDHPDNQRKLHTEAIPLVGGISLFLAVVITTPIALYLGVQHQDYFVSIGEIVFGWIPMDIARRVINIHPDDYFELLGLLIGSSILVVVGLLDDRFGIRGRQKLLGQFIATTALVAFGYHFEQVTIAGFTINFDVFSVLFVYAWVIAAINSVNLLDGADGICATIGIVMSSALCLMAIFQGQMANAIISMAIAGALLGFLRYNFPPAKVYLGDTGSMLVGFLLAALAIRCSFKQNSAYAFLAPVALLAIPFIDTAAAIIRRRMTGRSIFAVDRGHLHHALMKKGYSPRVSLLWVALLCATTAAGGVLSMLYQESNYAFASIAIVIAVMIACKIFGVGEFRLVSRRASSLAMSFFHLASNNRPEIIQSSIHVQGTRDWQFVWKELSRFADQHRLLELTLDLNAPWLHESFHATRRRSDVARGGIHEWNTQIPLIADGRLFGRIEIIGNGDEDMTHQEVIKNAMELTAGIEASFLETDKDATCVVMAPRVADEGDRPRPLATGADVGGRGDAGERPSDEVSGSTASTPK